MTTPWLRVIAHADMDAFYASVEQLDDPALVGRELIVGPNSLRGVVPVSYTHLTLPTKA